MRREWMLHVLPPVGAACAGRIKPPGDMQSGREIHGVLRKRAFPAEGDCRLSVSAFPGAGERGAGGSEASPAHRRASEANLKVERLAQPISRPEHQRATRRDGAQTEGERSEPEGRAFWRKGHSMAFLKKKPTGTPECSEGAFRCAGGASICPVKRIARSSGL